MKRKHNLISGIICVFFGVLNLLVSIQGNVIIAPFNYAMGILCCPIGALNIGIWFGRNE